MGLMDKLKNLFTEEVDEVIEVEEPIKKEVTQVEIASPVPRRQTPEPEEQYSKLEEPTTLEPKKEEYKFPFFDDEDFTTLEKQKAGKEEKKKSSYRKETKEVYSPAKEERKVFKPTPIISPVYGILDKNYQKEDIKTKAVKPRSYYNAKEATIDEIRNKAYGTLEDDIETTLFGKNRVLFEDEVEEPTDLIEENIEVDEEVMDTIIPTEHTNDIIGDKPRHGLEGEEDLTDLLQAELGQPEPEEEPRKISDSELFSMIDSMYQKGDKK